MTTYFLLILVTSASHYGVSVSTTRIDRNYRDLATCQKAAAEVRGSSKIYSDSAVGDIRQITVGICVPANE
jgi:hypothetical protein